ncbi:hypothetical protein A4A49_58207, partial [Nicotiana attenuata]
IAVFNIFSSKFLSPALSFISAIVSLNFQYFLLQKVVVSVKVFGLKTYKAKLVVFARRARKVKAAKWAHITKILNSSPSVDLVKVTEEMKSFNA